MTLTAFSKSSGITSFNTWAFMIQVWLYDYGSILYWFLSSKTLAADFLCIAYLTKGDM